MICRNCGAGLEIQGINTSLGVVTCSHCGSLHDIPNDSAERSSGSSNVSAIAKKSVRREVALPRRFKVRRTSGGMEIIKSAGGIFPGIVLSVIAAAFAHVAVTSGMWILLIASVGLFYFAAVRAFNELRIRVDGARLEITQGPLPSPGTRKLDSSDILQLYATAHESRQETGSGSDRRVNVRKHYRLLANTKSSGRVTILGGLSDPHQALWLEQEIERLLGIVDEPVAGEYTG